MVPTVPRGTEPPRARVRTYRDHLWSPSYFAASCGGAPLSIIKQYVENQRRPA
ncbi:transposase [Saccharothrix ecbatanensis]|uniref:transposase n=1 Tax=Saccharothrix ecbatanensis TaxID=1105145 RepID=UPI0035E40EBC